jgi:hypothetical protein
MCIEIGGLLQKCLDTIHSSLHGASCTNQMVSRKQRRVIYAKQKTLLSTWIEYNKYQHLIEGSGGSLHQRDYCTVRTPSKTMRRVQHASSMNVGEHHNLSSPQRSFFRSKLYPQHQATAVAKRSDPCIPLCYRNPMSTPTSLIWTATNAAAHARSLCYLQAP